MIVTNGGAAISQTKDGCIFRALGFCSLNNIQLGSFRESYADCELTVASTQNRGLAL